jgi:hypothetical protein
MVPRVKRVGADFARLSSEFVELFRCEFCHGKCAAYVRAKRSRTHWGTICMAGP